MIRLVVVASIALIGIALGMYSLVQSQAKTITNLSTNNASLQEKYAAEVASSDQLRTQFLIERDVLAVSAGVQRAIAEGLANKLEIVNGKHNEKWYRDTLPSDADCMLGQEGNMQASACTNKPARPVTGTDTSTELASNKEQLDYTLQLEAALKSCNSDKAHVKAFIERSNASNNRE